MIIGEKFAFVASAEHLEELNALWISIAYDNQSHSNGPNKPLATRSDNKWNGELGCPSKTLRRLRIFS